MLYEVSEATVERYLNSHGTDINEGTKISVLDSSILC